MQPTSTPTPSGRHLPDGLMEEAGLDVLIAGFKPNVQYLLGGHRCFFFGHAPAIGQSRYPSLPVYLREKPDRSFFIGHAMDERQLAISGGSSHNRAPSD